MDFKNKGYWALLALILVGLFLYRSLWQTGEQAPSRQQLSVLQEEMSGHWDRIPAYPGTQAPEPQVDARPERIVWERLQPAEATYEQAKEFYSKELEDVGWHRVGEAKDVPGFASPVFLFGSGNYHLFLSREPQGILLRMTWDSRGDVLYHARIAK